MKKILIASAAAALLTVSGAAIAQERVFASADLNVRAGPGTNHAVIGTLGANDGATLLDCAQGSNWCRISYGGGEGWVSSNYLQTGGDERMAGGGSGVATGATTGAIGGALIGGPVGAVVGGVAGGAIGAGADAAGNNRNTGALTGATTGAIGGAIIGGPVGAVVGGVAGGTLGAGADVAAEGPVDDVIVGSTVPDTVPRSALPTHDETAPEFTAVRYGGYNLWVETATGRVVNVLR